MVTIEEYSAALGERRKQVEQAQQQVQQAQLKIPQRQLRIIDRLKKMKAFQQFGEQKSIAQEQIQSELEKQQQMEQEFAVQKTEQERQMAEYQQAIAEQERARLVNEAIKEIAERGGSAGAMSLDVVYKKYGREIASEAERFYESHKTREVPGYAKELQQMGLTVSELTPEKLEELTLPQLEKLADVGILERPKETMEVTELSPTRITEQIPRDIKLIQLEKPLYEPSTRLTEYEKTIPVTPFPFELKKPVEERIIKPIAKITTPIFQKIGDIKLPSIPLFILPSGTIKDVSKAIYQEVVPTISELSKKGWQDIESLIPSPETKKEIPIYQKGTKVWQPEIDYNEIVKGRYKEIIKDVKISEKTKDKISALTIEGTYQPKEGITYSPFRLGTKEGIIRHEVGHLVDYMKGGYGDEDYEKYGKSLGVVGNIKMALNRLSYGDKIKQEYYAEAFSKYIKNPSKFKEKYPDIAKEFESAMDISVIPKTIPIISQQVITLPEIKKEGISWLKPSVIIPTIFQKGFEWSLPGLGMEAIISAGELKPEEIEKYGVKELEKYTYEDYKKTPIKEGYEHISEKEFEEYKRKELLPQIIEARKKELGFGVAIPTLFFATWGALKAGKYVFGKIPEYRLRTTTTGVPEEYLIKKEGEPLYYRWTKEIKEEGGKGKFTIFQYVPEQEVGYASRWNKFWFSGEPSKWEIMKFPKPKLEYTIPISNFFGQPIRQDLPYTALWAKVRGVPRGLQSMKEIEELMWQREARGKLFYVEPSGRMVSLKRIFKLPEAQQKVWTGGGIIQKKVISKPAEVVKEKGLKVKFPAEKLEIIAKKPKALLQEGKIKVTELFTGKPTKEYYLAGEIIPYKEMIVLPEGFKLFETILGAKEIVKPSVKRLFGYTGKGIKILPQEISEFPFKVPKRLVRSPMQMKDYLKGKLLKIPEPPQDFQFLQFRGTGMKTPFEKTFQQQVLAKAILKKPSPVKIPKQPKSVLEEVVPRELPIMVGGAGLKEIPYAGTGLYERTEEIYGGMMRPISIETSKSEQIDFVNLKAITIEKPMIKEKIEITQIQEQAKILKSMEKEKLRIEQILKQIQKPIIKEKILQKLIVLQKMIVLQKLKVRQELKQILKITPKLTTLRLKITPRPKPKLRLKIIPRPKTEDEYDLIKRKPQEKEYVVAPFVKRYGEWLQMAKPTTKEKAIAIGVRKLRETLGASLQLRTRKGEKVPFAKPTKEFRLGAKEGAVTLVQRAPRRLFSFQERKEIKMARKGIKWI